ncbi:MAG: MFS transporter [Acidimicrobiia bacterium]|nr:MFS transporter [Acidimicrobiia bacterium]MBT8194207.1 MFS transporter [Acidimicrobiia bacterium]NNJ46390.1 MFS transporter [Acidimicrobiia bacterium]NNL98177.1 MFS transporter [Acidimicrobiia bacterium]
MTGRPGPGHPDRQWAPLLALSTTVAVSFGVLLYSVSVLITEEAAGSVFSTTVLSAGYGGALLVGGLFAPSVGRRADRLGVRLIFVTGIVLGACGVSVLSVANAPWHVLAAFWLLIGPAGSMTFYEPAFVAVEQWFGSARRARSLAVLTVIGGLAGPVFLPLTSALVDSLGWRPAARVLALVLIGVGAPAAVLMARTVSGHAGPVSQESRMATLRRLMRDRRFVSYTLSVALMFLCVQAILLHRIALFEAGGFAVATASAGAAAASLLSFPGRFTAPFMARAWGGLRIQLVALLFLAASAAVAIDGSQTWQLVAHFFVFGLAFGAMLPIRASIMGEWYADESFGQVMGSQWMVASVAGALGPAVVGMVRDATDGYGVPMVLVTAGLVVAAGLTVASARMPASG